MFFKFPASCKEVPNKNHKRKKLHKYNIVQVVKVILSKGLIKSKNKMYNVCRKRNTSIIPE